MRDFSGLTLLVSDKPDPERDAVAEAWRERGGAVQRLGRFWDPPALDAGATRVYGHDTFCLVLAQKLGLTLTSPSDDLIASVPREHLGREVRIVPLEEALRSFFPAFVKPLVPKQFSARVYTTRDALREETRGLDPGAGTIRSEVVAIDAEARAFVLDGAVLDASIYEGEASAPEHFLESLAGRIEAPSAWVLDAAFIRGVGWAFLEANAAWGAGLNGCSASRVLPCIERASAPAA